MTSIKRSGVQVNILDESTAQTNFDRLVSGIIGFIFLDTNESLVLSNIREQIYQQLDDDQIGHNFIFLKNSVPISMKQEYLFNIQSIALSIQDLHPIEDELTSGNILYLKYKCMLELKNNRSWNNKLYKIHECKFRSSITFSTT